MGRICGIWVLGVRSTCGLNLRGAACGNATDTVNRTHNKRTDLSVIDAAGISRQSGDSVACMIECVGAIRTGQCQAGCSYEA